MSDNLRKALFDELDKPGTITKARLRNILIDIPASHPDESARELMAQGWERGYTAGHSIAMRRMSDEPGAPTAPNPYRQPINLPGAAK